MPPAEAVEKKAHEVLRQLARRVAERIGRRPEAAEFYPIELEEVASMLGWKVEGVAMIGYDRLLRPIHGRVDFDKRVIQLDTRAMETEGRQRYTLAHELGHAVLHRASLSCGEQEFSMYRVSSERRLSRDRTPRQARFREDEVERFAGHLLMPEKAIRAHFGRLFSKDRFSAASHVVLRQFGLPTTTPLRPIEVRTQLAEHVATFRDDTMASLDDFFGVSRAAMERRLRELGLVV